MLGTRKSRIIASVLALLGLVGILLVTTGSISNAQDDVSHQDKIGTWQGQPCPDVLVIGARGSGETPQGDGAVDTTAYINDSTDGMGDMNFDVYQSLLATAPQLRIAYEGVQYAAEPVPGGPNTPSLISTPHAYLSNANAGAGWMVQEIGLVDTQCQHHTKFVLTGYSQGAWVVHKTLNQLNSDRLTQIVGVTMFGDPLFQAGELINRVNQTTDNRNGISHDVDLANVAIPQVIQRVTGDYCNVPDPFCQAQLKLPDEHFTYKTNGLTKKAAAFVRPFLPGPPPPLQSILPGHDAQGGDPPVANAPAPPAPPTTDVQPAVPAQPIPVPQKPTPAPPVQPAPPPPAPPVPPQPIAAPPGYLHVDMNQTCVDDYGAGYTSQYQDPNDYNSWVCKNSAGEIVGGLSVQGFCSKYNATSVIKQDDQIPAYWWKCQIGNSSVTPDPGSTIVD